MSAVLGETDRAIARADRVLDAAGELLLRLGYRKVTVSDIARRAGVGKGTIYLHWPSKDAVFHALLMRTGIQVGAELSERLRQDPALVVPHRLLAETFLLTYQHPLAHAMYTGDIELLGQLAEDLPSKHRQLDADFYATLREFGLVREDVPNLPHALSATLSGFHLVDKLDPEAAALDVHSRAAALSHVVRHAFEPPQEPEPDVLVDAAHHLCRTFDEALRIYRDLVYHHTNPA